MDAGRKSERRRRGEERRQEGREREAYTPQIPPVHVLPSSAVSVRQHPQGKKTLEKLFLGIRPPGGK